MPKVKVKGMFKAGICTVKLNVSFQLSSMKVITKPCVAALEIRLRIAVDKSLIITTSYTAQLKKDLKEEYQVSLR